MNFVPAELSSASHPMATGKKKNTKTQKQSPPVLRRDAAGGVVKSGLTIAHKKEWAKTLFLANDLSQKDIAAKVGTSENTMSKWVRDEQWESLRKSLLTTKSEILRRLYDFLDQETTKNDKGEININADKIIKLTASIRNLETETSIGEMIETGQRFIKTVQAKDMQLALTIANEFDAFIKERLKQF